MALQITFSPMALVPKQFVVGDVVRVSVLFSYTASESSTIELLACPYAGLLGQLVTACEGMAEIPLSAATVPTPKEASVDFVLVPKANGGIADGAHGLVVWARSKGSNVGPNSLWGVLARASQDDVLIVTGNPAIIDTTTQMLSMIMIIMMLGMVMPMITPMLEEGAE